MQVSQENGPEEDFGFSMCSVAGVPEAARELLSRVGDKWSVLVLSSLAGGSVRFTRLQEQVPGISHRMLTVTLRALTRDGLVTRTDHGGVPPRVEYALTGLGATLITQVSAMVAWVSEHLEEVQSHREEYDRQQATAGKA